jgi:hypothetical protein
MENNQPGIASRYRQFVSFVKEADKAIETWIFHWIDQIESEDERKSEKEHKGGKYRYL